MDEQDKIIVFQEKQIRRVWHNNEWYFSVIDVIEVLTETSNPTDYLKKMRKRDEELKSFIGTNCPQVAVEGTGGKRKTLVANTQSLFRIIQSIPSRNAEPLKLWLAKVGYERVQEMASLAGFQGSGYLSVYAASKAFDRVLAESLWYEWKNRGVKEGTEYAILTAEISKATFGLAPTDYKQIKGLSRENLRDHMTNLELIFTMLGEESTKQVSTKKDARGFNENKKAAIEGGKAAGNALEAYEKSSGDKVVTSQNFKQQIAKAKKKKISPDPSTDNNK